MKTGLWATLGLMAGLSLGAAPQALAQNKVQLGVVTALSGPMAAPGVFQMNGFKLAVEELNAAGGISVAGRKYTVELKVYDTRASPSEGASAMQRLATVDKVPVVLGELSSGVAAAIAPIAQDYSMPLILTVPTGPNLTEQNNPFLFRVNAHNQQLNVALATSCPNKAGLQIVHRVEQRRRSRWCNRAQGNPAHHQGRLRGLFQCG